MLVTADVIGLYSYIHHVTELKAPKNPINNRKTRSISTEELWKWQGLFWKATLLDLMGKVKKHYPVTAKGTKCTTYYAYSFMKKSKPNLLPVTRINLKYNSDTSMIFSLFEHATEKLKAFLEDLNDFISNLKFTNEFLTWALNYQKKELIRPLHQRYR